MSLHDLRPYPEECQRIRELFGAREDGPLAPGEEVLLQDHLEECEDCHSVASWIPGVEALAHGIRGAQPPEETYFAGVRDSVMAKVREASRESRPSIARPWWRRWPVIAPTALVVALAGVLTLRLSERPEVREDDMVAASKPTLGEPQSAAQEPSTQAATETPEPSPEEEAPGATDAAVATPTTVAEGAAEPQRIPQAMPRTLAKAEKLAPSTPPVSGGRTSLGSTTALADADEISSLLEAYQQAVAAAGTDSENAAVSRLLDVLDTEAGRETAKRPIGMVRAREERQALTARSNERDDSDLTIADAIASHLAERARELDDAELRERIEAWLESR